MQGLYLIIGKVVYWVILVPISLFIVLAILSAIAKKYASIRTCSYFLQAQRRIF